MKKKICKVGHTNNPEDRLRGVAVFRLTGPCPITGNRIIENFVGTRDEAEGRLEKILARETYTVEKHIAKDRKSILSKISEAGGRVLTKKRLNRLWHVEAAYESQRS